MALTPKQKLFVDEYLVDLNATRAYKVAYPRVKNDDVAAPAAAMLRLLITSRNECRSGRNEQKLRRIE